MTEQKKRGMKSLGALLDLPKAGTGPVQPPAPRAEATAPAPQAPERPTSTAGERTAAAPQRPSPARTAAPAPSASPEPQNAPEVSVRPAERYRRFEDFERKDTRQRSEQIAWIEQKRKELNRTRAQAGERLTDNTLYRVAIDLLISRGDELAGTTEAELRASLGLEEGDLV